MKHLLSVAVILSAVVAIYGCEKKKKSNDIIAQRVISVKPQAPIRMPAWSDSIGVQWISGRHYQVTIVRQPSDSLPMVKDEAGQKFVDKGIRIMVSRADGSVFFNRTFVKSDFGRCLDAEFNSTGILEGIVFNRVDGDWLEFAASVSQPQSDEYIPLIVRLSRMGDVTFNRDSQMDTNAAQSSDTESED